MENLFIRLSIIAIIMVIIFSCNDDPVPGNQEEACEETLTDVDGNSYTVVKIGSQCWMAENLQTTRYSDGTMIPQGQMDQNLYQNDSSKYYFNYEPHLNPDYEVLYDFLNENSKLYTWAAATNQESDGSELAQIQGVCPQGWCLPNATDWEELIDFVGNTTAGISLKSTNPLYWMIEDPALAGTDQYGFNAIGSGGRDSFGTYYIIEWFAYYWSATINEDRNTVLTPYLQSQFPDVQWGNYNKSNSFCVRCVKDL